MPISAVLYRIQMIEVCCPKIEVKKEGISRTTVFFVFYVYAGKKEMMLKKEKKGQLEDEEREREREREERHSFRRKTRDGKDRSSYSMSSIAFLFSLVFPFSINVRKLI